MNREMSASPTTAVANAQKNPFYTDVKGLVNNNIGSVMNESLRLFPDGLLLGSALFALLTQNFAYVMFFIVVLESFLVSIGLNRAFSFIDLGRTKLTKGSVTDKCNSGFQSPTAEGLANMFQFGAVSGFPSTHLFVGASSFSYIVFSMSNLIQELSALGPEYSTRYYIGLGLGALLLLILSVHRLSYDCEGFGTILISIILGIGFGYGFYIQNTMIAGRESVNILNIPLFKYKDSEGKPIYICPPTQ